MNLFRDAKPWQAVFVGSLALLVSLAAMATNSLAVEDNSSDAKKDQKWQVLFDGSSVDAWKAYGAKEGAEFPKSWVIEGDSLTLKGQGGDIITREKFENFELRFEWKISEGGNSGVMYRVKETEQPSFFTGPEYQVLDNAGTGVKPNAKTAAGALYDLYSPAKEVARPAGEWNQARIVINEGHLEHWLNGEKVVETKLGGDDWKERVAKSKFATWGEFGKVANGHIALQDHGNQVWYRNIKIRRLDGKKKEAKSDSAEGKSSSTAQPARILFVSQSSGFRHSTVTRKPHELSHTEQVMTELGIRSGEFRIDVTQDVETDFKPELLENYNVVMFYTTGDLPIPEETLQWFLNDWLKQPGHGFLGVHSATDTYHNYEPYWDMVGGTFESHPWDSNSTVTVSVHDTEHPAAKPWGKEFVIKDEIYHFKNWQPEKVRVLMSLSMEKTSLKKPYHVPVCWVKNYGEGRVMYMSLGHREDVWTNPLFQESLLGGIRWLNGSATGDATPNPEVSAQEHQKARAAADQS